MNEVCREYVRQVEASMACSRRNRGKLLSGFERELEEAFPDDAAPAVAELTARFGTPEALAAELMAALPEGAAAVAA